MAEEDLLLLCRRAVIRSGIVIRLVRTSRTLRTHRVAGLATLRKGTEGNGNQERFNGFLEFPPKDINSRQKTDGDVLGHSARCCPPIPRIASCNIHGYGDGREQGVGAIG